MARRLPDKVYEKTEKAKSKSHHQLKIMQIDHRRAPTLHVYKRKNGTLHKKSTNKNHIRLIHFLIYDIFKLQK